MKLTVKPEARQSVFAGATSPDEQRAALAKYLEQDQPSGISIELTPEERASIGEVTPSSVLNFARQKVGGKPSPAQVAPSAGSSLGPAIDMTAFDAARRVASIPRRELRQMPSQTVEAFSEIMEMGLRSSAAPRVADKIDKETRPTLKGSRSTFEKFFDYVDAGLSVPAIGKLVTSRSPVLLAVARPMFSVLSANADIAALKEMTPDERRSWLATVEDGQPHKEVYAELVDRLDTWKPREVQAFGALRGVARIPGTLEDTGLQDLKMKLAGVYFKPGNTADPYGGGAPRPWSNDAVDAVDVVMRGALGFDADDVSKYRPKVQQISSAIGAPFRELISFAKASPEVLSSLSDAMESKDFVPIFKAMGLGGGGVEFASDWFDRYKRQAEVDRAAHKQAMAQDRSAGMLPANLAAMVSLDLTLPAGAAGAAERLVDTPIGKIAREAEAGRLLDAETHSSRIIDEATELRGRKLTPEEESELRARTGAAVDVLYSAARDNRSGVVRGVDTTDAIRLVDADEGLLVVPDTSKITLDVRPKRSLIEELARPIEGERNLFPPDAPVVRAAKAAGGKIIGMIDDDQDGLGIVALTGAEKVRQIFGKGPPIVVLDKTNGQWRKPRPGDVVGDSQWRLFRHFVGPRARSDMNFLRSEVTDAARAVFSGTANPQQRIIVGKLQEINGRPSEAAVNASELWQSIEDQVNKALKIAPDVLDDLSAAEKAALNAAEEADDALVRAQDELAEIEIELQMARSQNASAGPARQAANDRLNAARLDLEAAEQRLASASAPAAVRTGQSWKDDLSDEAFSRLSDIESGIKAVEDDLLQDIAGYVNQMPDTYGVAGGIGKGYIPRDEFINRYASSPEALRARIDEVAEDMIAKSKGLERTLILDLGDFGYKGPLTPKAVGDFLFDDAMKVVNRANNALTRLRKQVDDLEASVTPTGPDFSALKQSVDDAKARVASAQDEVNKASANQVDIDALQKAKADAEAAILKAAPNAKSARLAADDASVLRESTEKKLGSIGPSADSLEGNILGQIDTQAQRARILADVMESMTGSRSAAAAKARAELGKELRMIEQAAATAASDANLIKALDDVSLASARRAERAWKRAARNGFKDFEEFDSLPPKAKAAAETVREYFASVYRRLVAAGKLRGDTSLEEFFERNLVEGYIPHMLSKAGRKSLRKRLGQSGIDRNKWREVVDATKERTKQGTIEEINQAAREKVADMVRRDALDRGATPAEADEVFRDWMERLKDDIYFENDPLRILPRYAEDTARGLANTAMIKDLINLFRDGERFASAVKDIGLEGAEKLARESGYRRVDNLTLLRSFNPELSMWRGWKSEAIQKLAGFPPERLDEVLEALKAAGAPIGDTASAGIKRELGKPVFMPMQVADEFERMAAPSVWAGLPEVMKDVFRDYTSVWKTMMTVVAPAFHGRNWISNVVASYLSNGWDAVSPSTQIAAHRILMASDNTSITIGKTTMTAKEWRNAFRKGGVIQDTVAVTGGRVGDELRVAKGRAALAGAAGAATGATIGVQTAEPGDNRLARAVAFGAAGAAAGASGSANFDLFLRNAVQAGGGGLRAVADIPRGVGSTLGIVGQSAANKARWAARKEELFRDLAEPLKKSGRVGFGNSVVGLLWGLGTGDVLGATALAGGGGAAASLASEAAAVLGGSAGRHIEDMAKIGNAIAEIKRGGSMSAAAKAAARATFDYADLTRFEKEAFRAVIPFYTWTKKNIALQADLMANNPREYNLLVKAMNASTYEGDMLPLDEYYGHRWIVGLGMGSVLAGMGTGPEAAVEILTKGPKGVLSSLNPLPKAALERFWGDSGQSFYYKKPPTEITNGRDYEALPKWFKDKVGYRDDLVDPRKPGKKLQPRIGWYELTASELNELSSGSVPYQKLLSMQLARDPDGKMYRRDIERGAYWHQLFSSHPVSRLMREFNKAMKVSFQSALADEQGSPATPGERAASLLFSAKVTNLPEQTPERIEDARREVFLDKMERISDALFMQDQAYDLRVIPKVYQAPAGKYVPE